MESLPLVMYLKKEPLIDFSFLCRFYVAEVSDLTTIVMRSKRLREVFSLNSDFKAIDSVRLI